MVSADRRSGPASGRCSPWPPWLKAKLVRSVAWAGPTWESGLQVDVVAQGQPGGLGGYNPAPVSGCVAVRNFGDFEPLDLFRISDFVLWIAGVTVTRRSEPVRPAGHGALGFGVVLLPHRGRPRVQVVDAVDELGGRVGVNLGLALAVFVVFNRQVAGRAISLRLPCLGMSAPVGQKRTSWLTQPLSPRTTVLVLGGLVLAAVIGLGGWKLYEQWESRHRSPAKARALIAQYLYKQTGQKAFRTEATAALLTDPEVWVPPTPAVTNISAWVTNLVSGTNRIASQLMRNILRPAPTPEGELKRRLRGRVDEAMDYKSVFRIIGEYLWLADQLLAESDSSRHDVGVQLAAEVGRVALDDACSPWLAARICEAYLWPQLEFAETNQTRLDIDVVMGLARSAFRQAGETNNLIRSYKLLIEKAPQSARADKARVELGALLEAQGDLAAALEQYKAVKNKSSRLQLRIANLEGRLQRKAKR